MSEQAFRGPIFGCGIEVRQDGRRTFLETSDLGLLRDRLGAPLLVAFARAFAGVNQLATLNHLLALNDEAEPPRERVATNRNLVTIIFLSWGVMRETAKAIMGLEEARIVDRLDELSDWRKLAAIGKRWTRDEELEVVRNQLAFHLGERQDFERGLEIMLRDPSSKRLIIEADENSVAHAWWHLGPNMLFAGLSENTKCDAKGQPINIEQDTIGEIATRVRDDQGHVAPLVGSLFDQVVRVSEERAPKGGDYAART